MPVSAVDHRHRRPHQPGQLENRHAGGQGLGSERRFGYDELVARDKASLDITWLRDDSLEDADNLPAPEVIAREIIEDLEAALTEFTAVAQSPTNEDEA